MIDEQINPEGKVPEKLIASLREGIAVVQMIFFKELKDILIKKHGDQPTEYISMLCGSITNEVFGTRNTEERFETFRKENLAVIEQQLLGLKDELPAMRKAVTDALRVQVLCDDHEKQDSSSTLTNADQIGFLVKDRELPLPSTFMTIVRTLGESHNLIIAPVQISPEDDQAMVH